LPGRPSDDWLWSCGHEVEDFIDGITKEQASNLLKQDANLAEQAVGRFIRVALTDGQFDALVSFTFNLGSGALQRSTLRSKLNRKDYAGASREFSRWVWAGGRRLKGLVRRRHAEATLFAQN